MFVCVQWEWYVCMCAHTDPCNLSTLSALFHVAVHPVRSSFSCWKEGKANESESESECVCVCVCVCVYVERSEGESEREVVRETGMHNVWERESERGSEWACVCMHVYMHVIVVWVCERKEKKSAQTLSPSLSFASTVWTFSCHSFSIRLAIDRFVCASARKRRRARESERERVCVCCEGCGRKCTHTTYTLAFTCSHSLSQCLSCPFHPLHPHTPASVLMISPLGSSH